MFIYAALSVPLILLFSIVSWGPDYEQWRPEPRAGRIILWMDAKGCLTDECPAYQLFVYEDGSIDFFGAHLTRAAGVQHWKLSPDGFHELLVFLERGPIPSRGHWRDVVRRGVDCSAISVWSEKALKRARAPITEDSGFALAVTCPKGTDGANAWLQELLRLSHADARVQSESALRP